MIEYSFNSDSDSDSNSDSNSGSDSGSDSEGSLSSDNSEIIEEIENKYVGEILNNKYLIIKYIGKGTFSKVFLVYNLINDKFFALKMLSEEYREEGLHETKIYRILNSDKNSKIVEYIDTFEHERCICLVTEFMGIALIDALDTFEEPPRTLILSSIIDTLKGLHELHKSKIIHGDLKLENIMLSTMTTNTQKYIEWFNSINIQEYRQKFYETKQHIKTSLQKKFNLYIQDIFKTHLSNRKIELVESNINGNACENDTFSISNITHSKIIDLGNAEYLESEVGSGYIHIRNYRSPENFKYKIYNEKLDIWTLGCLILEMLSGTQFYDLNGEDYIEDFNTIEKSINNFNETFDRHLQDVKFKNNEEYRMFYNLVKNMLNLSYKERWSALNCINFLNTNINN